jgi:FtsP/CotA-like multicopper oxidase with cupredoxin domain
VEREAFVDSVIIAPSERAIVDVRFDHAGDVILEHRTPKETYRLAGFTVADAPAAPSLEDAFGRLRTGEELLAERGGLTARLAAPPDRTLALVAEMDLGGGASYFCPMHPEVTSDRAERCPKCGMKLVPASLSGVSPHGHAGHRQHDAPRSASADGIEWEDDMVDVNRMTTPANTRWKLVDRDTGAEGGAISWRFRVGQRVKIRLVNEMDSDHPMHHPFHIHGAGRFLILARDGALEQNLVWKDTVLVPTGQTVDILLEVTNPGRWMAHCHIAEHHESGMMLSFDVDP